MSETHASTKDHHESGLYEIRVKGHLDDRWTAWFEGLTITLEDNGDTLLTGPVIDQAALHGLLRKVRDLGMPLISVNPVGPGPPDYARDRPGRCVKCQIGSWRRRLVYAKINHNKEKEMNTKESPQGTDRKTAAVVGVLFIIGTVSGLLMFPFIAILSTPDHLTTIATNEGQMIIATLLKFIMGVACAGIGLALYPILKKYNEGLAIGTVGFRIIEGVVDVVGALGYVALLALSQEFVKAGAPASSYFQTADVLINASADWLRDVAMLLTWCIGALMYYSVFYQYRLVPRWLSVWGLVGITLTSISCLSVMFHLIPSAGTIQVILSLPIMVQEMVLAVWLIAKGINTSAVGSLSAKTATNELLSAA